MQSATRSPVRNRVFLLFIIASFVLPLLVAWLLVGQWRPTGTTNHGELLVPVQPVTYLRLYQADGQEIQEAYLRGRWTLAYVGAPADGCDKRCRDSLYDMRQVRLALGKDMGRVQTLFILTDTPDAALAAWVREAHAAMTVGISDVKTLDFFARAFPGGATLGDWIYLIDPLGNLFMRYGAESNPKGILDDLKRLLQFSKIG